MRKGEGPGDVRLGLWGAGGGDGKGLLWAYTYLLRYSASKPVSRALGEGAGGRDAPPPWRACAPDSAASSSSSRSCAVATRPRNSRAPSAATASRYLSFPIRAPPHF